MTEPRCRLDHLVFAVPDLEDGAAELRRRTGVDPTPGGAHRGPGTHNMLVGLDGGAYLEIIAPDPEQPPPRQPRPFGLDGLARPRLVSWALRVDDLDAAVARWRAAGYDPGPLRAMERRRPDGVVLSWRLTSPPATDASVMPFLIDWGESEHPSAALREELVLRRLALAHPSAPEIEVWLQALGHPMPIEVAPQPKMEAQLQGRIGLVVLE